METRKEKKSPIIRRGGGGCGGGEGTLVVARVGYDIYYLIVCLNEGTLVVARCGDLHPPLPPKIDPCLEDVYRTSGQ